METTNCGTQKQADSDGNDPDRTVNSTIATIQDDAIRDHEHEIDLDTDLGGKHNHGFTTYLWYRAFGGSNAAYPSERNVVNGPANHPDNHISSKNNSMETSKTIE